MICVANLRASAVREEVRRDQGKERADADVGDGADHEGEERHLQDDAQDDENRSRHKPEVQEHDLHEGLDGAAEFTRDGQIDEGADCGAVERHGQDKEEPSEHDERARAEDDAGHDDCGDEVNGVDQDAAEKRIPDLLHRGFWDQDEKLAAGILFQRISERPIEHHEGQDACRDQERIERHFISSDHPRGKGGGERESDHGDGEDLPLRETQAVVERLVQEDVRSEAAAETVAFELVASVFLTDDRDAF